MKKKAVVAGLGALLAVGFLAGKCDRNSDSPNTVVEDTDKIKRAPLKPRARRVVPNTIDTRRKLLGTEELKTREELEGLYTDPDELDFLTGLEGGQLPCLGDGNVIPGSIHPDFGKPGVPARNPEYDIFIECVAGLSLELREAVHAFMWRNSDARDMAREMELQDYEEETVFKTVLRGSVGALEEDGWALRTVSKRGRISIHLRDIAPDAVMGSLDIYFGTEYATDDHLVRDSGDQFVQYTARISDLNFPRGERPKFSADTPEELNRLILEWLNNAYPQD